MRTFVAFSVLIIPALYWCPPAFKFNIVQASVESSYYGRVPSAVADSSRSALQAHSYMAETYLNASLQYLDGLDRQLKADSPLSDSEVRRHADIYANESLQALRNAKVHLNEYWGVLSRAPASSGDKNLSETRVDLDRALSLNQALCTHLQVTQAQPGKRVLRDEIAKVRAQIKSSLRDTKSLKYASG